MMKNFKKIGLFIASFLIIFSSCSIDKKMYSSGYHVEWYGKSARSEKQKTNIAVQIPQQKNNFNPKIIFPETPITKKNFKFFQSFISTQNSISKNNFSEKNIFRQPKTVRVDSLKTVAQKNNFSADNTDKKWNEFSTLSIISIILGLLLFLIFLRYFFSGVLGILGTLIPILALIFFITGVVLGTISSAHIKKKPLTVEEKKQKTIQSKQADLVATIVAVCLVLLVVVVVIAAIFGAFVPH